MLLCLPLALQLQIYILAYGQKLSPINNLFKLWISHLTNLCCTHQALFSEALNAIAEKCILFPVAKA